MVAPTERLPLVIGVTGHRDLRDQDVSELEQAVSTIIARLRRDYIGNGGETPLLVLSALAEGADRLVARAALAQDARLAAPLPMPVEEYRRDFEPGLKPDNVAEFDDLLARAIAAPVMPFTPGNSLDAVRRDPERRAEQYRAVGLFIARHCHLLLALWDGDEKDQAAGGTAEVVTIKRGRTVGDGAARTSLDASEVGPVIHVLTPREKATSRTDKVMVMPWGHDAGLSGAATRGADSWNRFAAVVRLIGRFNSGAPPLENDGLDDNAGRRAIEIASRWRRS